MASDVNIICNNITSYYHSTNVHKFVTWSRKINIYFKIYELEHEIDREDPYNWFTWGSGKTCVQRTIIILKILTKYGRIES